MFLDDEKIKLWLVDDNADACEAFEDSFRDSFEVKSYHSADEALLELRDTPHSRKPDAILSDIVMPQKSGLDFAAEALSLCPEIPVLLMTGAANKEMFKQAVQIGVSGLVEKPFNPIDIKQLIRRSILRRVHNLLTERISNQLSHLLSTSDRLLSEYLHRYIAAENLLFDDPAFWEAKSPEARRDLLERVYRENVLLRAKQNHTDILNELILKQRRVATLLQDLIPEEAKKLT